MKAAYIAAAGAIIAALIAGLFTLIPEDSPTVNQIVSGNGTASIHTGKGDIHIGITPEQYESGLKRREQEVIQQFKMSHDDERHLLEIEKQAIQKHLLDLNQSYQDHIKDLRKRIAEMESLRGQVPDNVLRQARNALANGNTREADILFQQIEEQARGAISAAAEAAYQRGKIAEAEIHYQQAFDHFKRSARLVPDSSLYLNEAGLLADTLGQYRKAVEYYEHALASDLKTYGEDHPNVATYRNNLGSAWKALGKYEKAIK